MPIALGEEIASCAVAMSQGPREGGKNGCKPSSLPPLSISDDYLSSPPRSSCEVSKLLRLAGHAHEQAIASAVEALRAEYNERLLAAQHEVQALREQLVSHGILQVETGKWWEAPEAPDGKQALSSGSVAIKNIIELGKIDEVQCKDESNHRNSLVDNPTKHPATEQKLPGIDKMSRASVSFSFSSRVSCNSDISSTYGDAIQYSSTGRSSESFCVQSFDTSSQRSSRFSRKGPLAGVGNIINAELQLREKWTVHPEENNAESAIMLTKSMAPQKENEPDRKSRPTMRQTLRGASVRFNRYSAPHQCQCSAFIAAPGANWRLVWDLAGALLIGYDTIMIPFGLAFQPGENPFLTFMDWLTMLFWTADMVLTFFVGYTDRGRTIMSPVRIAKRYLMTWFLLDVMVVSGDWFNNVGRASSQNQAGSVSGLGKMVRSLRAIRVLRLLRLLKLRRMMAELQDHISSEYTYLLLSLTKLLFFILFLNHGIACLWYWLGRKAYEEKRPSWVEKNEMQKAELGYKYTTSLHWTLTQFTPASMEVMPQNTEERTMSVIVLMFALVAFSSFVGSISTSMTALRNMNADTNKQFWMLRRFLKQQCLSKPVGRRILKYLEYVVEKKQGKVQEAGIKILANLSSQLKEELTYELTCPNLMNSMFFQYYLGFPLMDVVVRKICVVAMKTLIFATSDVLFYPGDEASQVYCFLGGEVEFVEDEEIITPRLEEHEWIAEIALWTSWKHTSRCTAVHESELIAVNINNFLDECCRSVVSWTLASKYGHYFLQAVQQFDYPPGDLVRGTMVKQSIDMFCNRERHSFMSSTCGSPKGKKNSITGSMGSFSIFNMARSSGYSLGSSRTSAAVMTQRMANMSREKEDEP